MLEQRLPPCERDEATGRKDIATERMALLEKELRHHLLSAAPEHSSNAIIEIRAGAQGGDTHFRATEILLKLYRAAAERGLAEYPGGFKVEVLESEAPPKGALADGFKSLTLRIQGDGAYGLFRHEGGVHRFEMKGGGKAATVGLSVVVYPEVNELEAREFNIRNKDLEIRTSRASGKGGQHVNTTESAVRIKHLPTGVVVEIADERSQRENKAKALKILASRVKELQRKEHLGQLQGVRRAQRGLASHADAVRNYDLLNSERIKDNRLPSGNSRTLADCLRGEMIYLIRQVDLAQFDRELEEQTS